MTLTPLVQNGNHTDGYRFAGFAEPRYTLIPDIFFDEIMVYLSESELKVLLYIFRRTFGFKKDADTISLKQMVEGITTRDGRVLDHGAGVAKSSAWRGVKGLVAKHIIETVRNTSKAHGDEATTYRLVFADSVLQIETPPVSDSDTPRVSPRNTQRTGEQETERQGIEASKAPHIVDKYVDNPVDIPKIQPVVQVPPIVTLIADFSREMDDVKHLGSNITQAHRLFAESGLDIDAYFGVLYEARLRTRKAGGVINRMSYFFTVLKDLTNEPEGAVKS